MEFNQDIGRNIPVEVTKSIARKNRNGTTFPTGLIDFVLKKAKKQGHECDYQYHEPYILKRKLIPTLPGIKFDKAQLKMLRRIGIYKRGILVGPTGMGKSVILGGIIDKLYTPQTLCIVPNRTIFNQLYRHFCNWFGEDTVGRIGQGIQNPKHITVCMYQSIKNYKSARGLQMVLVDEAHLMNNTIIKFLNEKCKRVYYRYGVTATPHKEENEFAKAMNMIGYLGPVICEVNDQEVSTRVLPVEVNLISYYCGKPKGKNYQEVMRNDILLSQVRNIKLLKAVYDEALSKGKTALFLLDETRQGEIVAKIAFKMDIKCTFVHGGISKGKINKVIKDLNNRKIKFVVATKVFSTGTDIPNIDCVVLGSCRKSEIDTLQKIGRGRRRTESQDKLILIDSMDRIRGKKFNQYFYNYSIERLNIYKEKGWEIKRLTF
jgi:ATP-dependent helicase IRC3